ncbi:MAG: SGNH/GDSL hydrolase family protein [Vicinamibacterales bacterium]
MNAPSTGHIVLLGDSIFDNGSYTRGEPDVAGHLASVIPWTWRATLLAVDGATTADVPAQLDRVPDDATHLVLSVGGNDALLNSDLLEARACSSSEVLLMFATRVEAFERAYRRLVAQIVSFGRDVTICTIYNGALDPELARVARVALMTFNDVILRVAFAHRASVVDLRSICVDRSDYANPIEPSGTGGWKIASAIARAVGATPGARASRVVAGQ